MLLSSRIIGILLILSPMFVRAQEPDGFTAEAWLVSMPKEFSEPLLKRYENSTQREKLSSSVDQFDRFIKKGTFLELARFTGGGSAEGGDSFPHLSSRALYYPSRTRIVKEMGRKGLYRPKLRAHYGSGKEQGTRVLKASFCLPGDSEASSLTIASAGALGALWSPTAVFRQLDKTIVLLERDPRATVDYQPDTFALSLGPHSESDESESERAKGALMWYLSGLTSGIPLTYFSLENLTSGDATEPLFIGELKAVKGKPLLNCQFPGDPKKPDQGMQIANIPLPTMSKPTTSGSIMEQRVTKKATIRRFLKKTVQAHLEVLN